MLDNAMKDQLKEVFSKLENKIELVFKTSQHEKFKDFKSLLEDVAGTSDLIELKDSGKTSEAPYFEVHKEGKPNGIKFTGIPSGHEFTSLVLAILNSDLKGKLPDEMLQNRIKNLKGPIHLKTFISLSCENCPMVVQSLNLMAILKEDFEHEMIDGEFQQDEIERLNVRGVPSVMDKDTLISSGKVTLIELIEKLENHYGKEEETIDKKDLGLYDVVVVGAGPAGVSSAIYTARKGLKTAIITDRLGGQLQDTKGIENLISVSYTEGPELSQKLNTHMSDYDIEVLDNRRVTKVEKGTTKKLELNSHEEISTKALIVTTGAKWRELGVEGEKEYMGRGVAFCPHCDGPMYKGKDISVVGGGNSGVEAAIDLAGIVKSVTVIEYADSLKADSVLVEKLESLSNVRIIKNAKTSKIIGDGDKVTHLEYEDRESGELVALPLAGVFVQIGLVPNSDFVKDIVNLSPYGEIIVNEKCQTSEKGIYAAGDVTTVPFKQIVVAMGEGAKAGLTASEAIMMAS